MLVSHHHRVDFANLGDNCGLNIKGLDKPNTPRSGDALVYKNDTAADAEEAEDLPAAGRPAYLPAAEPPIDQADLKRFNSLRQLLGGDTQLFRAAWIAEQACRAV